MGEAKKANGKRVIFSLKSPPPGLRLKRNFKSPVNGAYTMKPICYDKDLFVKTAILLIGVSLLLGLFITGCSRGKTDQIIIRGSNTVGEELAPRLVAEFKKEHPNVVFDIEFKGSTYGFGALMVGRCDIGASSREVTTNELDLARARNVTFNEYVIGEYSVAVVVNTSNPLTNLTTDQVRDVFSGAIQNWKDIGGPDAPVQRYVRDPVSGTYLGFQEVAMDRRPYALGLKTLTNYAGIIQAVAQDANGIGYVGIELPKNPGVKVLSVNGVPPSAASVTSGRYPYGRVLRLYTDKARESSKASEFIQFVRSSRGQKILEEMDFVPRLSDGRP